MYKLKPFVNKNILRNVYYSIIYPHLIYGIQVWGSSFDTHLKCIEILQKKVVRMITHNDNFYPSGEKVHSLPLFYELKILKVKDIFKLELSKFVHDCLHSYSPPQFHDWFQKNSDMHNYDIRNKNDLFVPYGRTSYYGLKSPKIEGSLTWNKISDATRDKISRNAFKVSLKDELLSGYLEIS